MASCLVRSISAADKDAWFALWQSYLDFYGKTLDPKISEATWRRLMDTQEPIHGLVALQDASVVGFANYVLHPGTWTERPICYLEDLFVAAEARGAGAGRALVEGLVDLAKAQGWYRVYWQTKADNAQARRLYDALTPATDWVRYDIAVTAD